MDDPYDNVRRMMEILMRPRGERFNRVAEPDTQTAPAPNPITETDIEAFIAELNAGPEIPCQYAPHGLFDAYTGVVVPACSETVTHRIADCRKSILVCNNAAVYTAYRMRMFPTDLCVHCKRTLTVCWRIVPV